MLGVPIVAGDDVRRNIAPDSLLGGPVDLWSRAALWAAGVRVVTHQADRVSGSAARVYVSNHVSWFEIFGLATVLPRYRFVAKKELSRSRCLAVRHAK